MSLPKPVPGLVISYSYLWHDQRRLGADEGRKARPCAIIVTTEVDELTRVYVAPITHSPVPDGHGVEIPAAVKRRLRLDDAPSWIATTELNRFVWPGYDLRPISRSRPDVFSWGFLPVELFSELKRSIAINRRKRDFRLTSRD